MEKYLSPEEQENRQKQKRQELEVLRSELASIKGNKRVYVQDMGSNEANGKVFFLEKNLPRLKSRLERDIRDLSE